jgi:hypothetical protein
VLRSLLGLSALLLLLGPAPTWATATTAPELRFLELVHHERTTRGVTPLGLSAVISDDLSRPWSTTMAGRGTLSHSGSGNDVLRAVGRRYPDVSMAGENVGYAHTVADLHRALMESPGHRRNILDPGFRFLGLGVATSGQRVWVTQTFFAASDATPTIDPAPRPAITARWEALGGADGVLGPPTSAEYDVAGGRAQDFARGAVFWSPATGAHFLHGANLERYRDLGGPSSPLRLPTTDEAPATDGGAYNLFRTGRLLWHPSTGSWAVWGAIDEAYAASGAEWGPLGYPVSSERADSGGGARSEFARGAIAWHPSTGATVFARR